MPLPPGALAKPGSQSGRGDDAPPEEPHGLISGSAHERDPPCSSLQEWLQRGLGRQGSAISRSATLPAGYSYEFSKAVGSVALRHSNGIVVHDQLLVLGSSPGSNYVFGFHYCSSGAFREILKDPDCWPTLHCKTTTQREPAAFGGASKALKALLAEGLARTDMTADSFACCLPLRVPGEWLQSPGAARAGSPGLREVAQGAGNAETSLEEASSVRQQQSGSVEERKPRLGKEWKEKKSRRQVKAKVQSGALSTLLEASDEDEDSDADPVAPNLARASRGQTERTIAQDARQAAALDRQRLARTASSHSEGSKSTTSSRVPMPQDGEKFIKSTMFQWTRARLSGQKFKNLEFDIQHDQPFDVILRTSVPAAGKEWLAISIGERGGTMCIVTVISEASEQGPTRMWQLALEGDDRDECAAESGPLPCSPRDKVQMMCWISILRQRKERWAACLGEGPLIGESELLRLEGTVTAKLPLPEPVVRVSASIGPWDVEVAHTGNLAPGSASDVDAACKNAHIQDIHGRTALITAAALGDDKAVRALLIARANVHARDESWCTPLHFAAFEGHSAVASELLEAGGSLFAKNRSGCTPRDLARVRWTPRLPGEGEPWDSEEEEDERDLEQGRKKSPVPTAGRKKSPGPEASRKQNLGPSAGGRQGRKTSDILEVLARRPSSTSSSFAPPPRKITKASEAATPLRAGARTTEYLEGASFSGSRRRKQRSAEPRVKNEKTVMR